MDELWRMVWDELHDEALESGEFTPEEAHAFADRFVDDELAERLADIADYEREMHKDSK